MTTADTLIRNGYIVTVDADRRVFTNGFVALRDGRISAVGPMRDCEVTAKETIDAAGMIVMPGMANAHNHLVQNALRGYNDDRWPVLDIPAAVRALVAQLFRMAGHMDAERTYALVRLHALEMLKAGFTATHDEHFTNVRRDSVDGAWQAIADSGMRGYLCRCIVDAGVPEDGHEDVDAGLAEVERLKARFAGERIHVATGFLNFNFRADPLDMRRIVEGAQRLNVSLDVDMTDNSRGAALAGRGFEHGQVAYYADHGLLDHGPIYAGKGVNLRPEEFDMLARNDCRMALVPMLRFFDGAGLPLHEFLARGMIPGIGTDAPLVSDCQNPFEVMRQVILAQNLAVKAQRAAGGETPPIEHWASAERVIEMATIGGARALFMDDVSGSLEVGKAGDCVLVDLNRPDAQPTYDGRRALGTMVWAGQSSWVDTVFVAGRKLVEGGRAVGVDEDAIIADANRAVQAIARECDLDGFLPRRSGQVYRGWRYE